MRPSELLLATPKHINAQLRCSDSQLLIQRGERRLSTHREIKIGSVIDCQSVASCQRKNVRENAFSTGGVHLRSDDAQQVDELA